MSRQQVHFKTGLTVCPNGTGSSLGREKYQFSLNCVKPKRFVIRRFRSNIQAQTYGGEVHHLLKKARKGCEDQTLNSIEVPVPCDQFGTVIHDLCSNPYVITGDGGSLPFWGPNGQDRKISQWQGQKSANYALVLQSTGAFKRSLSHMLTRVSGNMTLVRAWAPTLIYFSKIVCLTCRLRQCTSK